MVWLAIAYSLCHLHYPASNMEDFSFFSIQHFLIDSGCRPNLFDRFELSKTFHVPRNNKGYGLYQVK